VAQHLAGAEHPHDAALGDHVSDTIFVARDVPEFHFGCRVILCYFEDLGEEVSGSHLPLWDARDDGIAAGPDGGQCAGLVALHLRGFAARMLPRVLSFGRQSQEAAISSCC